MLKCISSPFYIKIGKLTLIDLTKLPTSSKLNILPLQRLMVFCNRAREKQIFPPTSIPHPLHSSIARCCGCRVIRAFKSLPAKNAVTSFWHQRRGARINRPTQFQPSVRQRIAWKCLTLFGRIWHFFSLGLQTHDSVLLWLYCFCFLSLELPQTIPCSSLPVIRFAEERFLLYCSYWRINWTSVHFPLQKTLRKCFRPVQINLQSRLQIQD